MNFIFSWLGQEDQHRLKISESFSLPNDILSAVFDKIGTKGKQKYFISIFLIEIFYYNIKNFCSSNFRLITSIIPVLKKCIAHRKLYVF